MYPGQVGPFAGTLMCCAKHPHLGGFNTFLGYLTNCALI